MSKVVSEGKANFTSLLKGFDLATTTVGSTLGPCGRNVYLDNDMAPIITNDGATIATYIDLPNKHENMGAKLVKNTCGQTNDDAGDGTTTTAVLLQSIVHECLKRPENPLKVRKSLIEAGEKIIPLIKKQATKITKDDIKKVALISAEDEGIADAISKIIGKLGEHAVITVEDSPDGKLSYDIVEGYEAQCGFMSPQFITEKKRARAIMTDVPVFVSGRKLSSITDIKPLFDQFQARGISEAVIVCEDIENSLLGVLVASKMTGQFNSIVIRASGDALKDIEAAVGATRVGEETGLTFQNVDISKHLGRCKKVVSDANKTLFIPKDITLASKYANHLQKFANEEPNMFIRERLERRIAQLRGGIAILKIGSATDFDREYLKLKAEDAVKAAKSALEEGVVEGGGMCLWRIAQGIKPKKEDIGGQILKAALTGPLKKILENADEDYTTVINEMPKGQAFDAKNGKYRDFIKDGIIDPAKVERCALENAIFNAGQFITLSASIYDYVEEKK